MMTVGLFIILTITYSFDVGLYDYRISEISVKLLRKGGDNLNGAFFFVWGRLDEEKSGLFPKKMSSFSAFFKH